nr:MAG TPA: hypothetical protein [Caudoviricetes sp.]
MKIQTESLTLWKLCHRQYHLKYRFTVRDDKFYIK